MAPFLGLILKEGKEVKFDGSEDGMDDFILSKEPISEPIAYAYSQFDTNITDPMLESESFQDWMIAATMWGTTLWFPVPLEVIFPKGINGLIVAGRHLGVDHDTGQALRMNAAMSNTGEAVGIIAAAAVRRNIMPHSLPYRQIRELLRLPDSPLAENETIWGLDDDAIIRELATNTPGKAIWSAFRRNRRDLLHNIIGSTAPATPLYCHAAFALALLRDPVVIPILRRIVEERDNTLQCSLAFDFGINAPAISVCHGCIAIYLLGRFRDCEAIGLLDVVLSDSGPVDRPQYLTYAIVALLKIGDDHPGQRKKIAEILFQKIVTNNNLSIPLRFIKYAPGEYESVPHCKNLIDEKFVKWNINFSCRKAPV